MNRALCIVFHSDVRTGPNAGDRKSRLRLGDPSFRGGTIEIVDERVGPVIVSNPATDRATGESVRTVVPMSNVCEWEPLSEAMRAKFYPEEGKAEAEQKRGPGRPAKVAHEGATS